MKKKKPHLREKAKLKKQNCSPFELIQRRLYSLLEGRSYYRCRTVRKVVQIFDEKSHHLYVVHARHEMLLLEQGRQKRLSQTQVNWEYYAESYDVVTSSIHQLQSGCLANADIETIHFFKPQLINQGKSCFTCKNSELFKKNERYICLILTAL